MTRRSLLSLAAALVRAVALAAVAGIVAVPAAAAQPDPQVRIKTSEGTIVVELFPDRAPQHVRQFQFDSMCFGCRGQEGCLSCLERSVSCS